MQQGSSVSSAAGATDVECVFCQRESIATYILKETPTFLILADHAPLVEGHILIVPKEHYACYGSVPEALDVELETLKQEVQAFLSHSYAPAVFWEHGVFRQTVFHAHLHCFPFGEIAYTPDETLHNRMIVSQEDIRDWFASQGHYFYMEDKHHAFLFPPEMEHYLHVIQKVLRAGVIARRGHIEWRSPQQRIEEGKPFIEAMIAKWHTFHQQEVEYADQSHM